MADKRMIARSIVQSKRFLVMSLGAQALYLQLVIQADNDGVVEAFPVMRMCGAQLGDLDNLIRQGFVRWLIEDDVVVVLSDFQFMNLLKNFEKYPPGRYIQSLYEIYPELVRRDVNGNLPLLLQEYSGSTPGVIPENSLNTPPNKDNKDSGEEINTVQDRASYPQASSLTDGEIIALAMTLGVSSHTISALIGQYGVGIVEEQLSLMSRQRTTISRPDDWLTKACQQGWH